MRILAASLFALALTLVGCDNSASPDNATHDEALVGSWHLSDSQSLADGDTSQIVFNRDGTCSAKTHSISQGGSSSYSFQSAYECSSIGTWSTVSGKLIARYNMSCTVASKTTSTQGTKDTSYQTNESGTDTSWYSIHGSALTMVSSYSDGSKVEYDTTTFSKVLASRVLVPATGPHEFATGSEASPFSQGRLRFMGL